MNKYNAYNCTVIGQRYLDKGKPCEDSSISYNNNNIHIAIVADGHGDKKCFRSNIGSKLACDISLEKLKDFSFALQNENVESSIFDSSKSEKLISNLFCSIVGCWKERVLEHLSDNPPSDEEYESAGSNNAAIYKASKGLSHIYGTTLIAMLMTETYLLFLHQGDGRCVVMYDDGRIEQPVPWDPRCEGRNTASLCDEDVLSHWRYHLVNLSEESIVACYSVSDGIEDSFETQKELNAYLCMHAADYCDLGWETYMETLPTHFAMLTKKGSQDDISIGCIINPEMAKKHVKRYRLINEFYVTKSENRKANERLNSMKRKTDYLTQKLQNAQSAFDEVQSEESISLSLIEKLRISLKNQTEDLNQTTEKKEKAQKDLDSVQKEYDEYMAIRKEFEDKAEATQITMDELSNQISELTPNQSIDDTNSNDTEIAPIYIQPDTDNNEFDDVDEPIFEEETESIEELNSTANQNIDMANKQE